MSRTAYLAAVHSGTLTDPALAYALADPATYSFTVPGRGDVAVVLGTAVAHGDHFLASYRVTLPDTADGQPGEVLDGLDFEVPASRLPGTYMAALALLDLTGFLAGYPWLCAFVATLKPEWLAR